VPILGDVPVVGNLFKSKNVSATRRTLFVFMRPTVLRNQHDAAASADRSYRRLKEADAAEPPRQLLREEKVKRLPLEINGLY